MHSIEYSSLLDESKDNKFVIGFESSTTSPLGVSVKSYIDNNGNTYKTVKSDTENHEQVSRDVYDLLGRKIKEISVSAYAENNCSSYESVANFRIRAEEAEGTIVSDPNADAPDIDDAADVNENESNNEIEE